MRAKKLYFLMVIFLFTFSFFTLVLGVKSTPTGITYNYTFDVVDNSFTNEDIINGFNLRNVTEIVEGNYSGTFDFDDVAQLSSFEIQNDVECESVIITELANHNGVLKLYDGSNTGTISITKDILIISGVIEFYIYFTDVTQNYRIYMSNGTDQFSFYLDVMLGNLRYDDGSIHNIMSVSNDQWYHVSIEIDKIGVRDVTENYFKLRINGVLKGQYSYMNQSIGTNLVFTMNDTSSGYGMYLDALSYSGNTGLYNGSLNCNDLNEFIITEDAGTNITIGSFYKNHVDVLNFTDYSTGICQAVYPFDTVSGTLEFWLSVETGNYFFILPRFLDNDYPFYLKTMNGYINLYDGDGTTNIGSKNNDGSWFHVRIDFESSLGGYLGLGQYTANLYLDGVFVKLIDNWYHYQSDFGKFHIYTSTTGTDYNAYCDGIGLTIYDNYSIGDNKDDNLGSYKMGDNLLYEESISTSLEVNSYEFYSKENNELLYNSSAFPILYQSGDFGFTKSGSGSSNVYYVEDLNLSLNDYDHNIDVYGNIKGATAYSSLTQTYDFTGAQEFELYIDYLKLNCSKPAGMGDYDFNIMLNPSTGSDYGVNILYDGSQYTLTLIDLDGDSTSKVLNPTDDILLLLDLSLKISNGKIFLQFEWEDVMYALSLQYTTSFQDSTQLYILGQNPVTPTATDNFNYTLSNLCIYLNSNSLNENEWAWGYINSSEFLTMGQNIIELNCNASLMNTNSTFEYNGTGIEIFSNQFYNYTTTAGLFDYTILNFLIYGTSENFSITEESVRLYCNDLFECFGVINEGANTSSQSFCFVSDETFFCKLYSEGNDDEGYYVEFDIENIDVTGYVAVFSEMYSTSDTFSSYIQLKYLDQTTDNIVIDRDYKYNDARSMQDYKWITHFRFFVDTTNETQSGTYVLAGIDSISLVYYDIEDLEFGGLGIFSVIILIIVVIAPTFVIYVGISSRARDVGNKLFAPILALVSLLLYATSVLPLWLFFVFLLGCGGIVFFQYRTGYKSEGRD